MYIIRTSYTKKFSDLNKDFKDQTNLLTLCLIIKSPTFVNLTIIAGGERILA